MLINYLVDSVNAPLTESLAQSTPSDGVVSVDRHQIISNKLVEWSKHWKLVSTDTEYSSLAAQTS